METLSIDHSLTLREVSGGMTIHPSSTTHEIAKLSYDVDLERDSNEDLVAIPKPNVPSMAETLAKEVETFRKELREFREESRYQISSLNSQVSNLNNQNSSLSSQVSNLNNNLSLLTNQLSVERSKNNYHFGTVKIIRIWMEMLYDKKAHKNNNQEFKLFFSNFVNESTDKKSKFDKEIQEDFNLSDDDVNSIRKLYLQRNVKAHGEHEFSRCVCGGDPTAIKEAVQNLKSIAKDAEEYKEKDPQIIKITRAFLSEIEKEALSKKSK